MRPATRTERDRRRLAHVSLTAVVLFGGLAAMVLYRFPPAAYSFYPLCPIHEYLHLDCPGCGATRALAALLHGQLGEAMRLNGLFVGVVLPGAVVYGLLSYARAVRGHEIRGPQVPNSAIYACVGVTLAFTVLRNL